MPPAGALPPGRRKLLLGSLWRLDAGSSWRHGDNDTGELLCNPHSLEETLVEGTGNHPAQGIIDRRMNYEPF